MRYQHWVNYPIAGETFVFDYLDVRDPSVCAHRMSDGAYSVIVTTAQSDRQDMLQLLLTDVALDALRAQSDKALKGEHDA